MDRISEAVGWNMRSDCMAAPQCAKVIPESSLDVKGQRMAVHGIFDIDTLPELYVATEKCGADISPGPESGTLFVDGHKTTQNGKRIWSRSNP